MRESILPAFLYTLLTCNLSSAAATIASHSVNALSEVLVNWCKSRSFILITLSLLAGLEPCWGKIISKMMILLCFPRTGTILRRICSCIPREPISKRRRSRQSLLALLYVRWIDKIWRLRGIRGIGLEGIEEKIVAKRAKTRRPNKNESKMVQVEEITRCLKTNNIGDDKDYSRTLWARDDVRWIWER